MKINSICTLAALALSASAALAADGPVINTVAAINTWQGTSKETAAMAAAPKSGVITTADQWKALWTAWRGAEALPAVDFSKEIVLVATSSGPNTVRAVVQRKGDDVTILAMSTRMGGPGFGYALVQVSREGIKTVEGKPLEAPATQAKP